jgi:hypothetical protein
MKLLPRKLPLMSTSGSPNKNENGHRTRTTGLPDAQRAAREKVDRGPEAVKYRLGRNRMAPAIGAEGGLALFDRITFSDEEFADSSCA